MDTGSMVMATDTGKVQRKRNNRMVSFLSEANKSGSSMNYAYLEAYRMRKKEMLASEIDFSEDENFSKNNLSGNYVFLESYRKRKRKNLAAELNIVELPHNVSKEKNDGSPKSLPRMHESFVAAADSNKKTSESLQLVPQKRDSSVPAYYEEEMIRKKELRSLPNGNNERSTVDKKPTVSNRRFNRFSEEISDDEPVNFFDEPNSDATLLTSALDSHSNLAFFDKKPDSFQSSSDVHSDSGKSTGGFVSNAVKSNTTTNSGMADKKNEQRKPSKGKAKVVVWIGVVVMIVCGFFVISKARSDSLINDDENISSFTEDHTNSDITQTTEPTKNTEDTTNENSTSSATSESTTESSVEETTTTSATKHYEALSPGQQNDDVMKMQKRLAKLGYIKKDSCTGYYGKYTEKIVKMFQQKAGLKQTGIADSETLARLYADDAPDCLHG